MSVRRKKKFVDPDAHYLRFLAQLRNAGRSNMYGAIPYLMDEFRVSRDEAFRVVCRWIDLRAAHEAQAAASGESAPERSAGLRFEPVGRRGGSTPPRPAAPRGEQITLQLAEPTSPPAPAPAPAEKSRAVRAPSRGARTSGGRTAAPAAASAKPVVSKPSSSQSSSKSSSKVAPKKPAAAPKAVAPKAEAPTTPLRTKAGGRAKPAAAAKASKPSKPSKPSKSSRPSKVDGAKVTAKPAASKPAAPKPEAPKPKAGGRAKKPVEPAAARRAA